MKRSDLAGWAEYGYCASHSRFFWGLRLHLVATRHGLPIVWALSGAKADERDVFEDMLGMLPPHLATAVAADGQTTMGDKNYFGRQFEQRPQPRRHHGSTTDPSLVKSPALVVSSSNHCARSSSQSSTPSKTNSISNATTPAPPPEYWPGSPPGSSP
ncbi:MAG: hypothetical protein R2722_12300 [Tessaracoccus sp.]